MESRARQTLRWCRLPERGRLLEIGPGRGVLAWKALAHEYWAVDRDGTAKDRLPQSTHSIGTALPMRLSYFDAVVAESVLEHMSGYLEADGMVNGIAALLKPWGRLVLRVPDIQFAGWSFWAHTEDHQYVTSLPRAVKLVEAAGLRIVRAGYAIDHLTGPVVWPIWIAAQCAKWPIWAAERLWGIPPWQMSLSVKLRYKQPHAYVVAEKPGATI